jgi:hypothetical protein
MKVSNKSIKFIFNYVLGPLIFVLLTWSLYVQIMQQPNLELRWRQIVETRKNPLLGLIFLLMLVNWGIEGLKWKMLTKPLERLSFFGAFRSVLAGCSITMLMPNRTGEFGGRLLFLQPQNRLAGISATIMGSMNQLMITLFVGGIGMIVLHNNPVFLSKLPQVVGTDSGFQFLLLGSSGFILFFLIVFIFKTQWILWGIKKVKWLRGVVKYVEIIERYGGKVLLMLTTYSILRYFVFILQYILMMQVMQVNIDSNLQFWLLTVFYLVMAVIPTIGFTELPIRGSVSMLLFGIFSTNAIGIQAASFGIWLINLVIPALAGGFFILGVKLMKEKK